jgi:hypothetical protein
MTVFGTYQGASTIMRKTLDWKRSRIFTFEVEAVPHSCIPYFQIGLSIALYMWIWCIWRVVTSVQVVIAFW